ncbi:hypothetical protein [Micromonospora sp. ATA51]|uniref:hypothetical protein n=1 Tax=Micromonospora sp. ATA51 TaxID=2806098 RepID=UPI001A576B2E|nr:hypothetical protein [Micromonospora sp. ATA51]MBM0226686.1 hypothetical protein [Micromonospora sp. ATA51]
MILVDVDGDGDGDVSVGRGMMLGMKAWADGDLAEPFERRLDALLARLCPDWAPPALPDEYAANPRFVAYNRLNAKRMQAAGRLREQPDYALSAADQVLDAIVHDEDVSFNRQLIEPMLATVGRRAVQQHLITVVETGSPLQQVCAVRAWYWSQAVMVYESSEPLRTGRPTGASRARDDEVADLRGRYRAACLTAFVDCDDAATREWLARGFLLDASFYPPSLHGIVARARTIAEADPVRFKDLLARTSDGTSLAALRFDDR